MDRTSVDIARTLHRALEAGEHGEALRRHFTSDAETIEHPNAIRPTGGRLALADMLAGSSAGTRLLAAQRYDEIDAIALGDLAIIRLVWTGTIATDVGPFRAGQILTAHIAQFVSTRDGCIARIETFDCYEPFARPAAAA